MKDALAVHHLLIEKDVHHEIIRLRRPVSTGDELPEVLGLPAARCLVVRMYEADTGLVAVGVRAGDAPTASAVRRAARATRVRPARAWRVNAVTDYAAGLVCPLLLPCEVTLFVDGRVLPADVVYTPTGEPCTALGVHLADLIEVSGARLADFRPVDRSRWGAAAREVPVSSGP